MKEELLVVDVNVGNRQLNQGHVLLSCLGGIWTGVNSHRGQVLRLGGLDDVQELSEALCPWPDVNIILQRGQHLNQLDLGQASQLVLVQEEDQHILFKAEVTAVNDTIYLARVLQSVIINLVDDGLELRPGKDSSCLILLDGVGDEYEDVRRNAPHTRSLSC